MKIKTIDFGYVNLPKRAHHNDAGADVFSTINVTIPEYSTVKIPLGLGLILPDGYAACVFPRSGLSSCGIVCEMPPIDSGYRGEIHAIVTNNDDVPYEVKVGDRIGQLVIFPVVIADFVDDEDLVERGTRGFGSTGN